jgi:G3E family GTPase
LFSTKGAQTEEEQYQSYFNSIEYSLQDNDHKQSLNKSIDNIYQFNTKIIKKLKGLFSSKDNYNELNLGASNTIKRLAITDISSL